MSDIKSDKPPTYLRRTRDVSSFLRRHVHIYICRMSDLGDSPVIPRVSARFTNQTWKRCRTWAETQSYQRISRNSVHPSPRRGRRVSEFTSRRS